MTVLLSEVFNSGRDGQAPTRSAGTFELTPGSTVSIHVELDMRPVPGDSVGYAGAAYLIPAAASTPPSGPVNGDKLLTCANTVFGHLEIYDAVIAISATDDGAGHYAITLLTASHTSNGVARSGPVLGIHDYITVGTEYQFWANSAEQHHGADNENIVTVLVEDDVVEPEPDPPPPDPGIDYEVHDPDDVTLGDLTLAADKSVRIALKQPGSGQFSIRRDLSEADLVDQANWVVVTVPRIDPDPIFRFGMDTLEPVIVAQEGQGDELLEVSGRGALAYLDRVVAWKESFVVPAGDIADGIMHGPASTGNTPGEILYRSILEWQHEDRPQQPIPLLVAEFDYDGDSNGDPWEEMPATADMALGRVGERGLGAINRLLGTGGIDIIMAPDLHLYAYNEYGRDLTGSDFGPGVVRFVKGVNIADRMERQFGPGLPATHMLSRGSPGGYGYGELPDASDRPTVEGFVQTEGTGDDYLDAVALSELFRGLRRGESVIFRVYVPETNEELDESAGYYLPGPEGTNGHYWIGDTVTLSTGEGTYDFDEENARIMAVTLAVNDAGQLEAWVELKATIIMGRLISTGTPGTIGAGSGVGSSYTPPGGGEVPSEPSVGPQLNAHLTDAVDAHDASAVSFDPTGLVNIAADNVQEALEQADAGFTSGLTSLLAHGNLGATETFDQSAAVWHTGTLNSNCVFTFAGAIAGRASEMVLVLDTGAGGFTITWPASVADSAELTARLDLAAVGATYTIPFYTLDGGTTWIWTFDASASEHEADTSDAHDASAISFSPASGIAATDAQAAIVEAKTDAQTYADAGDAAHVAAADPHTQYTEEADDRSVAIVVDGAGAVPSTGVKAAFRMPRAGHFRANRVASPANVSGSAVFDVWVAAFGAAPPTVANTITAAAKPTLSSAKMSQDATLTGWTTAFSAGDWVVINLDSIATLTLVVLELTMDWS